MIAFGAAIGLTLAPALAEMKPSPDPSASAATTTRHTGSYRSEMRKRRNLSKERARASAEHMRTMRSQ